MDLTVTKESSPGVDITDERNGGVTREGEGMVSVEYVPDVAEQLRAALNPSTAAPEVRTTAVGYVLMIRDERTKTHLLAIYYGFVVARVLRTN